jgi:hypothetical protein
MNCEQKAFWAKIAQNAEHRGLWHTYRCFTALPVCVLQTSVMRKILQILQSCQKSNHVNHENQIEITVLTNSRSEQFLPETPMQLTN